MKIKIKSKTKKGKFIYGNFLKNKNARTTIIFLSGFSGSEEFLLFKHASDFFLKNNFNTVRFNFCSEPDDSSQKTDALKLEQMSFSVYMKELKNILDTFSKKSKKTVLIGHSFGAVVSILFLNRYRRYKKSTELILWEPSLLPWPKKGMEKIFSYRHNFYYMKNRSEILNKIFYNECTTINSVKIFHSLHKKAYVIAAKNSADKDAKKYVSRPVVIANTNHFFDGKKAQRELFEKTFNFLEK